MRFFAEVGAEAIGQWYMRATAFLLPLLVAAQGVRALFFPSKPREEQTVGRGEMETELAKLEVRLKDVETAHSTLVQALYELKTKIAELSAVMAENLRFFRGEYRR